MFPLLPAIAGAWVGFKAWAFGNKPEATREPTPTKAPTTAALYDPLGEPSADPVYVPAVVGWDVATDSPYPDRAVMADPYTNNPTGYESPVTYQGGS